jgi:hypothetical protein
MDTNEIKVYAVAETSNGGFVVWVHLYTSIEDVLKIKIAEIRETFEGDEEMVEQLTSPYKEHLAEDLSSLDYLEISHAMEGTIVIQQVKTK